MKATSFVNIIRIYANILMRFLTPFSDYAFGKCIPIYEEEPEDGSLYQ